MAEKAWRDEDVLRQKYHEEGKGLKTIADELGTSLSTVYNWMDEHDIERRGKGINAPNSYKDKIYTDESWLREKYNEQNKSLTEMAEIADVGMSTIHYWMDKYGIERREGRRKVKYASLYMNSYGHPVWRSQTQKGGDKMFPVHRLLAVAEYGVEAVKGKEVHHRNRIPWDNRVENIDLLTKSEHSKLHAKEQGTG